jgi:hypothetical protein
MYHYLTHFYNGLKIIINQPESKIKNFLQMNKKYVSNTKIVYPSIYHFPVLDEKFYD